MQKFLDYFNDPRRLIRFWAFWTITWIALDPISVVTHLQDRIWWLNQMSDFANFASCGTALVAAWSYYRARRVDEANIHHKLNKLAAHHGVEDWPE